MKKLTLYLATLSVIFLSACGNNLSDKNETKAPAERNIDKYFKNHDMAYVAEDAVFKNMTTGEETKGRKAIGDMLNYLYSVAFDAQADVKFTMANDSSAVLEAMFTGKHIGDFAGIPATGKAVNVPLCVVYDLNKEGLIQSARFYLLTDVLMQQLKAN
ncbi:MAG: ester cyclase [Saprospiraceae bacterium]